MWKDQKTGQCGRNIMIKDMESRKGCQVGNTAYGVLQAIDHYSCLVSLVWDVGDLESGLSNYTLVIWHWPVFTCILKENS